MRTTPLSAPPVLDHRTAVAVFGPGALLVEWSAGLETLLELEAGSLRPGLSAADMLARLRRFTSGRPQGDGMPDENDRLLLPSGRIITIQRAALPSGTVHVSFTDSTMHRAEATAREHLLPILETFREAVFAVDGKRRLSYLNGAASVLFETNRETAIGKMVWHVAPSLREGLEAVLEKALTEDAFTSCELEYPPAQRWYDVRITPFDGGASVLLFDITASRSARGLLAARHRHLAIALDNMSHGLALFDREQTLVLANRKYAELHGLPEGAIKPGVKLRELVERSVALENSSPQEATRIVDERLAAALAGEWHVLRQRRADGRVIEVVHQPLPGGGVVSALNDVTDQERRESELKAARDAADAASKTKSSFLASMSHELRTPLNAIIGFSEIIREELMGPIGSEIYKTYAADIHHSGQHLLALINDILDISKIEAGKLELRDEKVDLVAAMRSCLLLVTSQAEKGGVDLVNEIPADLPYVMADDRALKQAVLNLLSNAVKFTPPGGRVSVAARRDAARGLGLVIKDTGIGMTPENAVRVFEPFYQADSDLNRRYEGTGLGLPLVKGLIEQHGGTVELQSELNVGTAVTIWLPPERVRPARRS